MAKNQLGKWAFLLGLLVAIIAAFVEFEPVAGVLILVLGIIVGVMNVKDKDATAFVVAVLGLGVGLASIDAISVLGTQIAAWVKSIIQNALLLLGAAAIVVAGKAAYKMAKE